MTRLRSSSVRTGTYRKHTAAYGGTAEIQMKEEEGGSSVSRCSLLSGLEVGAGTAAGQLASTLLDNCWRAMLGDVVRWFRGADGDTHSGDGDTDDAASPTPSTPRKGTTTMMTMPTAQETLEVYAFIAAAEESKVRGGGRGGDATVTLEEVLEPARKAAQVVLDREWYTPGTARALALGGRLGAAPFLALVSDEEAAMITGRAIIDRRADRVSDEMATSSISDIAEEASWFGESADGFGTAPQWWEEMSIKKPPATAAAAVTEEAEAEAEAEAGRFQEGQEQGQEQEQEQVVEMDEE